MLLVNGWIKYTDLDNYKQGCIKSLGGCCGHDSFSASNIIDLLDKLKDFCGHDDGYNVVICDAKTKKPLFAFCYGELYEL